MNVVPYFSVRPLQHTKPGDALALNATQRILIPCESRLLLTGRLAQRRGMRNKNGLLSTHTQL